MPHSGAMSVKGSHHHQSNSRSHETASVPSCTVWWLLIVSLSALQPETIKVPLMAHVGSEDKFFPCKVILLPSCPFLQNSVSSCCPS